MNKPKVRLQGGIFVSPRMHAEVKRESKKFGHSDGVTCENAWNAYKGRTETATQQAKASAVAANELKGGK